MGAHLKRTSVYLGVRDAEELRRYAAERELSLSALLKEVVVEWLETQEDIREALKAREDTEGTLSWEEYEKLRALREARGELSA